MIVFVSLMCALIPGVDLVEQPYISERARVEARIALIAESVREIMDEPTFVVEEPWASLADCESGNWIDGGRDFEEGSARWDWAAPWMDLPPWGTTIHHGGLQFHPATWSWVAPDVLEDPPEFAYEATVQQQVAVAEEVQRRQGWGAWPVCSRLVGLR